MTSVALYNLTSEYRALLDNLSNLDLDAQTLADTIEASGLQDDITVKAQGIECIARSFEMHNPAIEAEILRLKAIQIARSRRAQALREYLKSNMIACGIDKIDSPLFSIRLQNNPPAVDVFEPGLVPAEFMTQPVAPPPAPDKAAIKAMLKTGVDVPGCKLTQGQRLVVS